MPIQLFADDSGTRGDGGKFVIAGLLNMSEDWETFTDGWQAVLDIEPTLDYLKMNEAAQLRGQFEGWSLADRDIRIREFVEVIKRTSPTVVHCIVDCEGWAEWFTNSHKNMRHPSIIGHLVLVISAWYELLERGYKEPFEVIFDEDLIFAPRVKAVYPVLHRVADPNFKHMLPADPVFRDDEEFLPLQAADMFAWLLRRQLQDKRHPLQWVQGALEPMESSPHSQTLTKEVVTVWGLILGLDAAGFLDISSL